VSRVGREKQSTENLECAAGSTQQLETGRSGAKRRAAWGCAGSQQMATEKGSRLGWGVSRQSELRDCGEESGADGKQNLGFWRGRVGTDGRLRPLNSAHMQGGINGWGRGISWAGEGAYERKGDNHARVLLPRRQDEREDRVGAFGPPGRAYCNVHEE